MMSKIWQNICRDWLFPFFAKYVVPQLIFMKRGEFYLESEPEFKYIGKRKGANTILCASTTANYTNHEGRKARLRVEIIP